MPEIWLGGGSRMQKGDGRKCTTETSAYFKSLPSQAGLSLLTQDRAVVGRRLHGPSSLHQWAGFSGQSQDACVIEPPARQVHKNPC